MVGSGHSALSIHVSLSAAMSADYHPSQLCVATLSAMAGADGVWRCAASTVVESSTTAAPLHRAVLRASLDRLAEEGVVVAVLRQHAVPRPLPPPLPLPPTPSPTLTRIHNL